MMDEIKDDTGKSDVAAGEIIIVRSDAVFFIADHTFFNPSN